MAPKVLGEHDLALLSPVLCGHQVTACLLQTLALRSVFLCVSFAACWLSRALSGSLFLTQLHAELTITLFPSARVLSLTPQSLLISALALGREKYLNLDGSSKVVSSPS